jgi:hypothetical protein
MSKVAVLLLLVGLAAPACRPSPSGDELAGTRSALTAGWTMVTAPLPAGYVGTGALLTDGRLLLSGAGATTTWYTFTPDATGSYQNGTWNPVASSPNAHWAHPSFVLRDGRFWSAGGEYPQPPADRATVDIFDPVTNTWSTAPDMPEEIADTPAALLADGRILVLAHASTLHSYIFNSYHVAPSWPSPSAPNWSSNIGDTESSSLLLPDGSVMVGSRAFQRYLPDTNTWVDTALPPGGYNALMLASGSDEFGPMVLLHDGRALVLGANENNALYTPPAVATDPGTWTAAAPVPAGLSHGDAPSVVEPDGRVLSVVTTDNSGLGLAPAIFYEYDPPTDSWTQIATPSNLNIDDAETVMLLALPNGQIWVSGSNTANAWLYTPAGTPQQAWRPTITSVSAPSYGDFTLSGVQLNGLTTGADFGDDNKMATNYPLVSLTDASGQVTYARSYDFDQMAPRPGVIGSCHFTVPDSLPDGTYTLSVSANGVQSANTVPITFSGTRAISLIGPAGVAAGSTGLMRVGVFPAAPAGGVVVNLISTAPSVGTVPATVTVPQGATGVNFNLTGTGWGKTTVKAATAVNGRHFLTRDVGWAVTGVSGPATVSSGGSASWTVTLDQPASANGVPVQLQSSNPAAATVPATVLVPSGATSATFDVTPVDPSAGSTTITASLIGSSKSGVFGYQLQGLVGPPTPQVGTAVTFQALLNGNAPTSGVTIQLQSSIPSAVSVPATVTVAAGFSSAYFNATMVDPLAAPSTVSATLGTTTLTKPVGYTITAHTAVPNPVPVGTTGTGTVTLNGPAPSPGGLLITLQNIHPTVVSSPASFTIPAGSSTGTYTLTGVNHGNDIIRARVGTAGAFLNVSVGGS